MLPSSCMRRVSVEAGVTDLWWKYLGCQGKPWASTVSASPLPEHRCWKNSA
ncbi:hypothetical protein M5E88_05055 [Akkermansia muciniphila]|nr:hypothetical protein M5E88_05055 [Akkermansia muciniphila]